MNKTIVFTVLAAAALAAHAQQDMHEIERERLSPRWYDNSRYAGTFCPIGNDQANPDHKGRNTQTSDSIKWHRRHRLGRCKGYQIAIV